MSFTVYFDSDCYDEEYEVSMREIIDNLTEFHESDLVRLHDEVHNYFRLPLVDSEIKSIETVQDLIEEADFMFEYKTIDDEYKMKAFMEVFNEFTSEEFEEMFKKLKKEKYAKIN